MLIILSHTVHNNNFEQIKREIVLIIEIEKIDLNNGFRESRVRDHLSNRMYRDV